MSISTEQKKVNQKWIEDMIPVAKIWMWKDECELYEFKDNKIYPASKSGSKKLRKIVTPLWAKVNIVDP